VDFARTHLNLHPQEKPVRISLKPDVWHEGPTFELEQAPFARLESVLPGRVEAERLAEGGARKVESAARLPAGRYRFLYTPPPGERSCEVVLVAHAYGTVREDNRPREVQESLELYRAEYLDSMLASTRAKCEPTEALEVTVVLHDGVFRNPYAPATRKVPRAAPSTGLRVSVDGQTRPYRWGEALEVPAGKTVRLAQEATASDTPP